MNKVFRVLGKKGRITIPLELRIKHRLKENDLLSFEDKGTEIIVKREKLCDGCKELQLKESSLLELLNELSPSEKKAALCYLLRSVDK